MSLLKPFSAGMQQLDAITCRDAAFGFLFGRINYERSHFVPYGQREFRLERMHRLLERLGNPHEKLKIVHVAGTKGKGSTSALIAAALSAAGYRTGVYSSPHLERLEERFMIDGRECPTLELVELIEEIRPIIEQIDAECTGPLAPETGPTYFEILTAIAFLYFARRNVDAAVVEVGLGGRLDSTNVCQPVVSVITSISYDHMELLGNSLGEIAAEKAGIIKPGVPVVSGATDAEPRRVITDVACHQNARLVQLGVHFDFKYLPPQKAECPGGRQQKGTVEFTDISRRERSSFEVKLALVGRHQAANAAVALAVLDELRSQGWRLSDADIRRGLASVQLPARVEVVSHRPTVVIDAAHNAASVQSLLETLDESFTATRKILVFGTTQEKDVRGMLALLLPQFERVIFTRYWNNPRAMSIAEVQQLASKMSTIEQHSFDSPAAAVEAALRMSSVDDLVCITGSFFLAAEARHAMEAIKGRGTDVFRA